MMKMTTTLCIPEHRRILVQQPLLLVVQQQHRQPKVAKVIFQPADTIGQWGFVIIIFFSQSVILVCARNNVTHPLLSITDSSIARSIFMVQTGSLDNNQTGYEGNGHADAARDNGQRSNHNGNYSQQDHRHEVRLQHDQMQHQQQQQQHQQQQQQSSTASSTVNNGSSNMKQERADGETAPKQTRRATASC